MFGCKKIRVHTYPNQTGIRDAVTNAGLLLKYGGVHAVKLAGPARTEPYRTLSNSGFRRGSFLGLELEGIGVLGNQMMGKAG